MDVLAPIWCLGHYKLNPGIGRHLAENLGERGSQTISVEHECATDASLITYHTLKNKIV